MTMRQIIWGITLTLLAVTADASGQSESITALISVSERGHVEIVKELLKTQIDIVHVNNLGWTALLEAIVLGDGG